MSEAIQLELGTMKRDWVEDAAAQLVALLPGLGEFTFDDLHPILPKPENENWFGVLAAKLRNHGLIRRVGAVASRRPEANGRLISVWRAAR